jgi:hypothetical protein
MIMREVELSKSAIEYVKSNMESTTGLASKIIELHRQVYRVITFASSENAPGEYANAEMALGDKSSHPAMYSWICRRIYVLFDEHPDGAIVVQDAWLKPADIKLTTSIKKFADALQFRADTDENIYYILRRNQFSPASLGVVLDAMGSMLEIVIFASCFVEEARSRGEASGLDRMRIDGLALNACEVFLSAYDHEGYVVWPLEQ